MSKARNISNLFSSSTDISTDAELAAEVKDLELNIIMEAK